jgi:hypothetical protein
VPVEALEHPIERLRLRARAREAVQEHARLRVRGAQPLAEHRDDEVVGHQVAAGHDRLGLLAERRAVAHRGAQHVACGDVSQAALGRDPGGLRALARAGRPHQDEIEGHSYFRKPL